MNDSTAVILGLSTLVLFIVVYVWLALALSAVFRKTGQDTWKAWVPVVNAATVLQAGGFSPWLVLIGLVPIFGWIASAVVWVIAVHRVSLGFGAGGGMTVLGALVPPVWASILGFGDARWQGAPASASGATDDDPMRRRQNFDGPYTPLVGGWTPTEDPERDVFALGSSDEEPGRHREPAPLSEPVALPFAAPSGSLADAVPAPVDWVPTARETTPEPAPQTSVFAALDALADSAPRDADPAPSQPDAPASERGAHDGLESDGERESAASTPEVVAAPVAWVPTAAPVPTAAETDDRERDDASDAPWANLSRRSSTPDAGEGPSPISSVPLTRPAPAPEPAPAPAAHDEFPEPSEAVSAVAGSPDAGSPRSARTSVSALYTQPEVPADGDDDDFDAMDRTVVARRRRIPWTLIPPSGAPVDITSTVVILGRRPAPDPERPDAQLVPISDETRTVSKTHARLELRADTWYVTDLGSTNGVLFATLMGTEVEAPSGEEIEAGERFFLGDAEVRLSRSEA